MNTTTIMMRNETKIKLENLKVSQSQTYDEVIQRLIMKAPRDIWAKEEEGELQS